MRLFCFQTEKKDHVSPLSVMGGLKDTNVPYPRSCGARFCGVDKLVLFGKRDRRVMLNNRTPRSFSAISAQMVLNAAPPPSQKVVVVVNGGKPRHNSTSVSEDSPSCKQAPDASKELVKDNKVTIYNCLGMQPFNKKLAER